MAATITLRCYTSTNAASESASVGGIDFISADNATNSSGNRTSNPVVTGTNSYSKHLRLKLDTAPNNSISNVKFWTDGSGVTNVSLKCKTVGSGGATPGSGDSTPSTTALTGGDTADAYTYTTSAKLTWDSGSYSVQNNVTKSLVLQLQPNSSATPGNWSETLYYSYDEA